MQQIKSSFLEKLRGGRDSVEAIAAQLGKDPATFWRWRQSDTDFDGAVALAQEDQDKVRVALVEDSLFLRLITGKARSAEVIFYLVNRGAGRWKHAWHLVHQNPDGSSLIPASALQDAMRTHVVEDEAVVGRIGAAG